MQTVHVTLTNRAAITGYKTGIPAPAAALVAIRGIILPDEERAGARGSDDTGG